MTDLRTEEVAPSKQDVPVAALHHLVAVGDEYKVAGGLKLLTQGVAGVRQLVGISTLNGEQEDPAGLAASQLRQQETLRRCCSIGQEIAQFTVDHHPCDNQPEAQ
jgi:hypothetical protein